MRLALRTILVVVPLVERHVILVAEDEPNDRFLIQRAFNACGPEYFVVFVTDGEEVISYLRGRPHFDDFEKCPAPCMLIADVKMPRLNGFDVLAWVRSQPEWHRLPVLVLSSSALEQDVQRAYDLTANTYLVKPPTYALLVKAVEELCRYWFASSQLPQCGSYVPAAPPGGRQAAPYG